MESQLDLLKTVMRIRPKWEEALPEVMKNYSAMRDNVFSDNKLTEKVKRLIGVGIAVCSGCDPCILFQTKQALDADASRDEIMEAVSVAVAMGGCTALGWSWRVVRLLEELEEWKNQV